MGLLRVRLSLQYRAALLSLMVDVATMLGAQERSAQADMEKALAFETKLAQVRDFSHITAVSYSFGGTDVTVFADPDPL